MNARNMSAQPAETGMSGLLTLHIESPICQCPDNVFSLNRSSFVDSFGMIPSNRNFLMPATEATILHRAIRQPVQAEESKGEARQCLNKEQPFPLRGYTLDVANTICDETAESASKGRRSEEEEDPHAEFIALVPKRQVVHDASTEETFESSEKDAAHEKTRIVGRNVL